MCQAHTEKCYNSVKERGSLRRKKDSGLSATQNLYRDASKHTIVKERG